MPWPRFMTCRTPMSLAALAVSRTLHCSGANKVLGQVQQEALIRACLGHSCPRASACSTSTAHETVSGSSSSRECGSSPCSSDCSRGCTAKPTRSHPPLLNHLLAAKQHAAVHVALQAVDVGRGCWPAVGPLDQRAPAGGAAARSRPPEHSRRHCAGRPGQQHAQRSAAQHSVAHHSTA